MSKLFDDAYRCVLLMKDTMVGNVIYSVLDTVGMRIAISRTRSYILNGKKFKNPTETMEQTRQYYSERRDDCEKVYKLLEDDQSKNCYRKMLKFRWTYDNRQLPYNSFRKQYFGNEYFQYNDGEVFVDCGAFDGDTLTKFKRVMRKHGKTIGMCIAVEADDRNVRNLRRNHPDAYVVEGGAWDKNQMLYFESGKGESCCINDADNTDGMDCGTVRIKAFALGEIPECQKATFIKMDIEGAEQKALIGLKNVIISNRPKLAISIYHKDEDMIDIPLMLHEWVPEYRLYVMQHTNSVPETVLYATI